jgi:hypothetical protein
MAKLVNALARETPLRTGITRHVADLIFVLTGTRSHQSFVLEARLAAARLGALGTATLRHDLFGD